MTEVAEKLCRIRSTLAESGLGGVRFRGVDGFAWVTGGASNVVVLAAETGVAEVLVTADDAWVLTNVIEQPRLRAEEPLAEFSWRIDAWQDEKDREGFILEQLKGRPAASDRPRTGELELPDAIVRERRRLEPSEIGRYRILGRHAAAAMTEVMFAARPEWTERALAGRGAEALWRRGIEPALVLVAGAGRLERFRHPIPTETPLGDRAMLVFCARRHGLYANLTRFVYFREPFAQERDCLHRLARVEAAAWRASRPGASLADVYAIVETAYASVGASHEIDRHHQGGTTGYRPREVIASLWTKHRIDSGTAFAWNPSFPGAKLEDTVLVSEDSFEVLTVDPRWPSFDCDGVARPAYAVRK